MMQEENKRPDEELSSADAPIEEVAEENVLSAFEQVSAPQKTTKKKRLSSNTRLLIAITAIVAALAVALAILLPLLSEGTGGSSNVSGSSDTSDLVLPIYDRSKDDTEEQIVRSVTISNSSGEYTVRYDTTDTVYKLVGYEELSLASGVEEMIDCVTTLNGYDRIKSVAALAEYGLEKPSATVDITYHDDSVTTLHIGDLTPDKAGYYVRLKDGEEVYMVDEGTISYFQLTQGQYVERTLIAAPTVKDDDTDGSAVLKELTLKGGPNNETLVLRRSYDSDGIEYSYATFVVTKPFMRMVDETVAESLEGFTSLIAGEGVVLHPTAADKQKYGFDAPYATVEVTLAVETVAETEESDSSTGETEDSELIYYNAVHHSITVGSKNESGNYYIMIDDLDVIYMIPADSLSVIVERTYKNTISELLFLKDITDVGKVQMTVSGETHELLLTHDETQEDSDDQLTVTYGGKQLDTATFRTLYSELMSLARYGDVLNAPTDEPIHGIKLYETDGSLFLSLEFYEHSASLYTVKTTEGELFTVKSSDLSSFITKFNSFIAD